MQLIGDKTSQKNVLDLVFCNEADLISDIKVSPIKISDHFMIEISSKIPLCPQIAKHKEHKKTGVSKFMFEDHHWPLINNAIEECEVLKSVEREADLSSAH